MHLQTGLGNVDQSLAARRGQSSGGLGGRCSVSKAAGRLGRQGSGAMLRAAARLVAASGSELLNVLLPDFLAKLNE